MRRRTASLAAVLAVAVLSAACDGNLSRRGGEDHPASEARGGEADTGGSDEGGAAEQQEQQDGTQARLEALAEARSQGIAGRTGPLTGKAAAGWGGEQLVSARHDDWEPALATDPNAPFAYLLTTRIDAAKQCQGHCPVPVIVLERSTDGGRTWGSGLPLCVCRGSSWQYDPEIEVVPNTGAVYAAWLNGFNTVFSKSTDHGKTWSDPVATHGNVSWTDKPLLTTSNDGSDIYVSFNGPTDGDIYVAQSHDAGKTWTQTKVSDTKRYYFAFGGYVGPGGRVTFSEGSLDYSGPAASPVGDVQVHAISSSDAGKTWTNTVIDSVAVGEACVSEGCGPDFYLGHTALAGDASGDLAIVYDGATVAGGPQRIWARRSTDGGRTWSPRTPLTPSGVGAAFAALAGTGRGDFRTWYMQENGGVDAWNVFYRSSKDGGATWSAAVKLSDANSGTDYKSPDGFLEPYGDYGELAITSGGKSLAVWGEGFSWNGPGGTWLNRQR